MDIKQALNLLPFEPPENQAEILEVAKVYPARISRYYLGLIRQPGDPIYRQCIPSIKELQCTICQDDPLCEESNSPVERLTHRYPDRALLVVTSNCRMYCRFCTRKRNIKKTIGTITDAQLDAATRYIRNHAEINDVIVSGGDPFTLATTVLEKIISSIRSIPHVRIIRIGTRIPCVDPDRINAELCRMLKKYHPVYVNVHFNHPMEITTESAKACSLLANAGIPLGNQSVLLKGINDDPATMKQLCLDLLAIRVKPYYLFIPDVVRSTSHFRTPISKGIDIIDSIRGWQSGMCVPQLVIDTEHGGGKIPLLPQYLQAVSMNRYTFRNFKGKRIEYVDV